MARIFINYRREDSGTVANIIYDQLSKNKKHTVFIDKKGIPGGFDFRTYITKEIIKYDIMLSIIGNQWITLKNKTNELRIQDDEDTLRMELAEGLKNNKMLIIPILVDSTTMPSKNLLPDDIQKIADLNAVQFKSDEIEKSIVGIIKKVERSIIILKNTNAEDKFLVSKDLSPFVKIIDLKDHTCVTHCIVNGMQANLLAEQKISAILNVNDLENNTRKVDGLKKDDGSYFETAIFNAEFKGIKVDKWLDIAKNGVKRARPDSVKLKSYRINRFTDMIAHLNDNHLLLTGVSVYDELWTNPKVLKSGLLNVKPSKKISSIGEHAILVSQIDLLHDKIKFVNSWGKGWGDHGFGYFTKETFTAYSSNQPVWALEATIF